MLIAFITFIGLICLLLIIYLSLQPSNDREWSKDQAILPYANFNDDYVTIHNIRHLKYQSEFEYAPGYYDKTFNMTKLKSVDYVASHFATWDGPAHAFLSFCFDNEGGEADYVAISIEIRKKKGQTFSPFLGLIRQFELMYVIADERDVILLRTHHRKHPVYIYPLKILPRDARIIFTGMIKRANKLYTEPEFYNTLWNSCSTNLADHINLALPRAISKWNYKVIITGYFDALLQRAGLIDGRPLKDIKHTFLINDKSLKYRAEDTEFSRGIRSAG